MFRHRRSSGLRSTLLLAAASLLLCPRCYTSGLLSSCRALLLPSCRAPHRCSHTARRVAALSAEQVLPRFQVGTKVRCRMSLTDWAQGEVVALRYQDRPTDPVVPYQVRLDNGCFIFVPEDDDQLIQGLDFWDSPLGNLRKRFESAHSVRWQPGQFELPAVAEKVPVVPHQLKRDMEQFQHLVSKGALSPELQEFVTDSVLPDYGRALQAAAAALEGSNSSAFALDYEPEFESLHGLYRKALHLHPGAAVQGGVIRERDFSALEQEFQEKEHRAIVIDDFFSPEALQQIREFLMDSTFWFDAKSGYVGSYAETGFACPLVAQIDEELRSKFPEVIGQYELQNCWAFMFDGSMGGVRTHADNAQVQINFFLTPSEANEWSENKELPGGGLVIYGVGPPSGMGFLDMNREDDQAKEAVLASTGYWNVTVPYVQNRAILFDSTYFHRTDNMKFKKGYKNRRINMTFLYGRRENLKPAAIMKH